MTVLPRPVYWLARRLMPVPCIDVLPVRSGHHGPQICLIRRAGPQAGTAGWALAGGRVHRGEHLADALARHLRETLGSRLDWDPPDLRRPALAVEYFPSPAIGRPVDPTKHAIALTYVVSARGDVSAGGEAIAAEWFDLPSRPPVADFVFDHGTVVEQLVQGDARLSVDATGDEAP